MLSVSSIEYHLTKTARLWRGPTDILTSCSPRVTGARMFFCCSPTVSMWVARADRAAGPRTGRGSMRREHTTSLARCESARGEPGGASGSCWHAHQLAPTSRFLVTGADTAVPFARAVVIVRGRGFDGHTEKVGLRVPVKKPTSSDQTRARQRYRALSHYVAATFIGFFPSLPLTLTIVRRRVSAPPSAMR